MTRSLLPICSVTSFFHCRICFDAEILSIRFSFNFRGLPGRRIFSVLIPGYANSFFGKYLLYILSMSVAGLGAMYSAIQSQASAILLLAELPAMGVCALLAMEISKIVEDGQCNFSSLKILLH